MKNGMMKADTIPGMFFAGVAHYGEKTALMQKGPEGYTAITWSELGQAVREVACGLITLGLEPGDRVAIMSYNRPEWVTADLAILAAGAITIPIYHTNTPAQADYILKASGVRNAFVARSDKAEMLATCDVAVERIFVLDEVGVDSPGSCAVDYYSLRFLGRENLSGARGAELDARIANLLPNDCATVIFTSGTTGAPKGVMLSHANILANVYACITAQPVGPNDTCLSFLPLSHSFERTVGQFMMLAAGTTIAYASSLREVADNIREVRPTVVLGVPRFFEKLYARVLDGVNQSSPARRALFFRAIEYSKKRLKLLRQEKEPGIILNIVNSIADRLIFSKLKKLLGGRMRFFVSGGAPLLPDIIEFFQAAGVIILQGYGLTEFSPVISVNRLEDNRPETVGPPLPGVEVKIADDGEIAVRGHSVMLGYYENEVATSEVIRDGWLYTGDLGELSDGYLKIVDRKKDIIITSGGKNITPQHIENLVMSDEYVEQAMVYGDGKKYLTALIVPDYERIDDSGADAGFTGYSPSELIDNKKFYDFIMSRITEKCEDLASFEKIKKIIILPESLTEERGEITPTMKIKRKALIEKYQQQIDALYSPEQVIKVRHRWP